MTIATEETIEADQETAVTYYVERQTFDDSVVVVGKRVKKEVVKRTIRVEEIRLIPGTNGDALERDSKPAWRCADTFWQYRPSFCEEAAALSLFEQPADPTRPFTSVVCAAPSRAR